MERAQRILKKFSKILKEQGAGPLFTTFKGYVTYDLYDRWKVRRLRKFPPRMVKNRILFETVMNVETSKEEIIINEEPVDLDGLNYLAGKTVDFINKSAMNGTILAHTDGNVPNLIVNIPEQNEYYLGQLFYFFEFACGISGYLLGVNPFNQPGVESYKKNMFALLGKPGFEAEREELLKRL